MNSNTVKKALAHAFGQRVQHNVEITNKTTLRTQSSAQYYFEANSREDLILAAKYTHELDIPLVVLGGGSNTAISKSKVVGLIVKNNYIRKEIVSKKNSEVELLVSSGYRVSSLVMETVKMGLGGLQYHAGLPGTIGGAVYMNSKWTNPQDYLIGDHMVRAILVDREGKGREESKEYFKFAYDYSIIQDTGEIVLEVIFRLAKSDTKKLTSEAKASLAYRHKTQPPATGSSGCFFQNITSEEKRKLKLHTVSAGNLIDRCGLKGVKIGDFYVSDKHANFILNAGRGNPKDLLKLINLVKKRVHDTFGVVIKEEVVVI